MQITLPNTFLKTWNITFFSFLCSWIGPRLWFSSGSKQAPCSHLLIGRGRVRKIMGCNKEGLVWEVKSALAIKAKHRIYCPLFMGRQRSATPKKTGPHHLWQWWNKNTRRQTPAVILRLYLSFPNFCCWGWCQMVLDIPLLSCDQLSWLCLLSCLHLVSPSLFVWRIRVKNKDFNVIKDSKTEYKK